MIFKCFNICLALIFKLSSIEKRDVESATPSFFLNQNGKSRNPSAKKLKNHLREGSYLSADFLFDG